MGRWCMSNTVCFNTQKPFALSHVGGVMTPEDNTCNLVVQHMFLIEWALEWLAQITFCKSIIPICQQ